ncbi:aspartoacylase [Methanobrevibacter cuticularis]|uniref:Aspartoacylase n=1 Tax=Methanobrevibacter cuticularis TaxID=47311 RepID=A0A166DJC2_9EURY|nr:succinylglutamate desuccinylase/aspartoacylase family protein [Methanobrevibacter cuticularis]KZX15660.1 aspartoacylase [Methanobrevibacter cuticularis]
MLINRKNKTNTLKIQDDLKLEFSHISHKAGGYISANSAVFENMPNTVTSRRILREATKGTPLIKMGSDSSPRVMLIAGIHGNELPPQIAILHLINKLECIEFDGTIYIIPFSAPKATMNNSRWFNRADLNRVASVNGSISNKIMGEIIKLKVDSVGDFHSTAPNSNPGREGVFCTSDPSPESYFIAEHIATKTKSAIICLSRAGGAYHGAIEDESNILGIPAVTCEVLCPNGTATKMAYERSLEQMESYLSYFGIIQ